MDLEFKKTVTVIRANQADRSRTAGGTWVLFGLAVLSMVATAWQLPNNPAGAIGLILLALFFAFTAVALDVDRTMRVEIDHGQREVRCFASAKYPAKGKNETYALSEIERIACLPEGSEATYADTFSVELMLRGGGRVSLPAIGAPLDAPARERQVELLNRLLWSRH